MTFYLKYRPQTIEELDSEAVRKQLSALVASNSPAGEIPHALLFSGPKGTGKTSAARILAKVLNCESPGKNGEPCNKCGQCKSITQGNNIDVIEMDAASNRGIDDVRSLKEKIILAPLNSSKKVYIIDEVHMLTAEAFNALLKTLEEPPDHVVFILATTDPHKIPETVKSRLTNVNFEKAKEGEIVRQLTRVARGEKLKLGSEIFPLIAKASDGSFRDAVKTLELIIANIKNVTSEKVREFLTQTRSLNTNTFFELLGKRDVGSLLLESEALAQKGVDMRNFLERLLTELHQALLAKSGMDTTDLSILTKSEVVLLIELFSGARMDAVSSPIAQLPIEIAVVKFCGDKKDQVVNEGFEDIKAEKQEEGKIEEQLQAGEKKEIEEAKWKEILGKVKSQNTSVEALLRAARPIGFDGKTLSLGIYYQFHKERLETIQNKKVLEDVCAQVLGQSVRISFCLTEKTIDVSLPASPPSLTDESDMDIIEAAKEIFGNV